MYAVVETVLETLYLQNSRRKEDNIKSDLRGTNFEDRGWWKWLRI
jgi:hypothetical protein